MANGLTLELARFAAAFPSESIPERTRPAAVRALLDALACVLVWLAEQSSRDVAAVLSPERIRRSHARRLE